MCKMILVTGATGYVGHRVVKRLCEQGKSVRVMVIKNDPLINRLDGLDCEIVTADITKPETLDSVVKGIKTCIHLAAVLVSHNRELFHKINYEGTKALVDKCVEAGVEHFIYISAAAANYKIRTDYGNSKVESEKIMVKKDNTNFTIIRPTIIYSKDGGQELMIYLDLMKKVPLVFPIVGSGKALKRPVFVEDIADGLSKLVDNPRTFGKTLNFAGGSEISLIGFTRLWARAHGVKRIMVPIPMTLVWLVVRLLGILMKKPPIDRNRVLGIINDANFSIKESKELIGYDPLPVDLGLAKAFDKETSYFK